LIFDKGNEATIYAKNADYKTNPQAYTKKISQQIETISLFGSLEDTPSVLLKSNKN
jgi:hypothetical protein